MQLYIFITYTIALLFMHSKKSSHRLLFAIITISVATEILSLILTYIGVKTGLLYTVSVVMHNSLWLILLTKDFLIKKAVIILLLSFLLVSILNFLFYEGSINFNNYTFIIGAFLYIVIFIYESFYQLKYDNFSFFSSNNYILLFAPVLFFFGLSFIFGFKNKELAATVVYGKVELYSFIGSFVNFIYYTLINIYIYKEKQQENA